MKKVLITGASSGIGLQLALDYHNTGWQVIACGRDPEKMALAYQGLDIEQLCFDISDSDECKSKLDPITDIDLAILNAGSCEYINTARSFDAARFNRVIQTNVCGTANCLAPISHNIKIGGRIAIISSASTFFPLSRAEAYGASKAALDYLARSLAIDLHQHGIGVSLIRPGFVDTPLTQKNNFAMPFLTSLPKASAHIRTGIEKGLAEISFPALFIVILKCLGCLPRGIQHRIALSMRKNDSSKAKS